MTYSRQYRWQLKKRKEGLCISCGKKRYNTTYCLKHSKASARRSKIWQGKHPNYAKKYKKIWLKKHPTYMRDYMRKYHVKKIKTKNYYEHRVAELLGLKPDGKDIKGKDYWLLTNPTKKKWIEIGKRISKILKGQGVINMGQRCLPFKKLKSEVQDYLTDNFSGKLLYVPAQPREPKHSKKLAIETLRKSGYTNSEICKAMGICPSIMTRIENQKGEAKRT